MMDASRSSLVIIDVQEKLYPACLDTERTVENCCFLVKCANRLNVPVVVTEQYPKGLGHTAPEILNLLEKTGDVQDGGNVVSKISFSSVPADGFLERSRKIRAAIRSLLRAWKPMSVYCRPCWN